MRLFHFSDNPRIELFEPRPIRVGVKRPNGQEWLNGPLVWSIDENHAFLYLFPRECPRILIWPTQKTTPKDRQTWFGDVPDCALAHIEQAWHQRFLTGAIYRYELPTESFVDVHDVGMWVSFKAVKPMHVTCISDLSTALRGCAVGLRVMKSLTPLRAVWQTSIQASGIRLRNASDWHDGDA